MTRPMFMANLRRLFPELDDLPHHDTLARLLAQMGDVNEIEEAHIQMLRHLIRGKKFERYLIAGRYPIAIDGTQKFKRAYRWDEDGLYPNGPIVEQCRAYNWDFMIVLQDDSLPLVWEEMEGLKELQPQNRLQQNWGDRRQYFRWVNGIDYRYACPKTRKEKQQRLHAVLCEESWEEIAPSSTEVVTKTSRHVWLPLPDATGPCPQCPGPLFLCAGEIRPRLGRARPYRFCAQHHCRSLDRRRRSESNRRRPLSTQTGMIGRRGRTPLQRVDRHSAILSTQENHLAQTFCPLP